MLFGLKNALIMFSCIVIATFCDFIHKFLEVYLDDWTMYILLKDHIGLLQLMLDHCRQLQISLNLLGHIVFRERVLVDPAKVAIILNMPPPTHCQIVVNYFWPYWISERCRF
jgi:hypothetical protein